MVVIILCEDISPDWGPGDHVRVGGDVLDLYDLGDLGFPKEVPIRKQTIETYNYILVFVRRCSDFGKLPLL